MVKAIEVNINIMANANGMILIVKDKIRNTLIQGFVPTCRSEPAC